MPDSQSIKRQSAIDNRRFPSSFRLSVSPSLLPAFSLLELMIAIVILGLGLVMVATIFPVAWTRTREMTEYTVERAVIANAHDTISATLRVPGRGLIESARLADGRHFAGFAGDVIPNPFRLGGPACPQQPALQTANTHVHILHLENRRLGSQLQNNGIVSEDPWEIERYSLQLFLPADLCNKCWSFCNQLIDQSYHRPQMRFHERFYPPLSPLKENPTMEEINRWEEALDTRRYAWAVLHRLRTLVSDPNASRLFDVYYVLLRRAQSTYRFARQDPAPASTPLRFDPDGSIEPVIVNPAPRGPDQDVILPVAWRVQVEFPDNLSRKADALGIPTEIEVPPAQTAGNVSVLSAMFQGGTQFIDELNGEVYRVSRRRPLPTDPERAVVTLEREVTIEDLDLRCLTCTPGELDEIERIRTVWVFPPPVAPRARPGDPLEFVGSQPVVNIAVRGLTLAPTR